MAIITINPTAHQTPDATLGGSAVTTPSNTGHAQTITVSTDGGISTKSIRWFTFLAVGVTKKTVTLKVDHDTQGGLSGAGASNLYTLEYTLNGGGSWNGLFNRSDFTSQVVATASVALSVGQDLTQVQVREDNRASTVDSGESASVTSTTAQVRIEIEPLVSPKPIMLG